MSKDRLSYWIAWSASGICTITIPVIAYTFMNLTHRVDAHDIELRSDKTDIVTLTEGVKFMRETQCIILTRFDKTDLKLDEMNKKMDQHIFMDYGKHANTSPVISVNRGEEIKENKKER